MVFYQWVVREEGDWGGGGGGRQGAGRGEGVVFCLLVGRKNGLFGWGSRAGFWIIRAGVERIFMDMNNGGKQVFAW